MFRDGMNLRTGFINTGVLYQKSYQKPFIHTEWIYGGYLNGLDFKWPVAGPVSSGGGEAAVIV